MKRERDEIRRFGRRRRRNHRVGLSLGKRCRYERESRRTVRGIIRVVVLGGEWAYADASLDVAILTGPWSPYTYPYP